jgi:hypothetical protein
MLSCLLFPAVVNGQAKPYLGASIGASFYDKSIEDVTGDDFKMEGEEFAWKIFGGITGRRFFAVEADYRDFGRIQNQDDNTELESKVTSWDVFAVGNLYLGPLGVFGKAGISWWREDSRVEDYPFDVTGHDFAWGLGAAIRLGGMGFRAEFERFEMEGDDRLITLTAGVSFGG